MKRILILLTAAAIILGFGGCTTTEYDKAVTATTAPVYAFAAHLCEGTDIAVTQLITENISCLHDYTLQVSQMKAVEKADAVIISGAGLEAFMEDILAGKDIIDASVGITLDCVQNHDTEHKEHHYEEDPHIWLSPKKAKVMAENICRGLSQKYPQYIDIFEKNLTALLDDLDELEKYGKESMSALGCRELLTFHDGFGYFAQAFDLTILHAIEEEAGREASAAELIDLCQLVEAHRLPAIFTERNGSLSAAYIISRETGANIYQLDMAMGENSYFDAMYHNIDAIKEALG